MRTTIGEKWLVVLCLPVSHRQVEKGQSLVTGAWSLLTEECLVWFGRNNIIN